MNESGNNRTSINPPRGRRYKGQLPEGRKVPWKVIIDQAGAQSIQKGLTQRKKLNAVFTAHNLSQHILTPYFMDDP